MANPNISAAKRLLRTRLQGTGEPLPNADTASSRLRARVLEWLASLPEVRTVATFAALPGEPELLPLLTDRPDLAWHFPRVAGRRIHLHRVTSPSQLSPGTFGVREPDAATPETAADGIDAFLCPGLAFDLAGHRLGHGAGYYDRLLATARPEALRCGVCFHSRLLPFVPADTHDATMGFVATEAGWFVTGSARNDSPAP